ncbi:hypothetical protein [Brevundimonas aurantiaca]|uniref:hypothetical protein n=1 Tax=Brevundimonas aurantiaca TaxID=74316 RepID=UPI001CD19DAF|nr:hypothetical protein [Brevundimonas aurantiaca]
MNIKTAFLTSAAAAFLIAAPALAQDAASTPPASRRRGRSFEPTEPATDAGRLGARP